MIKKYNAQMVYDQMEGLVAARGSQAKAAREMGISPQYFSDVLNKKRQPGETITDFFGLTRVYFYYPKEQVIDE